tara:strand:- start:915 stop:2471 length:1557 start_codon:yes stop_codon:yes gene_type:complete
MTAKQRYDVLSSERSQFLDVAEQAANLSLPYLIRGEEEPSGGMKNFKTPWQSIGSKGVVTLASKLMLALLPPQTSFFKLQMDDQMLAELGANPQIKSELDLSFSKIERTILESIAASDDRVVIHQALKHLVVAGNALIFMGRKNLKLFPLNRYVIDRDGNGNVIEIVTKERINKAVVEELLPKSKDPNSVSEEYNAHANQCDVYTHCKRDNNRFVWHQEVFGKIIPGSQGKAPIDTNPWIALRFNTVDSEPYGRGRVEEFIGDLKALESLTQALVEGSAAAAKVVFTVSPSSTTKPSTLAQAGNGAIIQGRPDDVGVITTGGKTADFQTAFQMTQTLERRLSEAFLILSVRQSERTTAEEVRMTQMELEQQLGGLFSLLTVDFLVPYLNRKLSVFQKTGEIPKIPKGMVKPTIVAGINALGRGQDRDSLGQFMQTIAQTIGPEALTRFINPDEVIKRLAAAQGIDTLNLVKTQEQLQQEMQQQMQQQQGMEITKQAGQLAAVEQKQNEVANQQAPEPQ